MKQTITIRRFSTVTLAEPQAVNVSLHGMRGDPPVLDRDPRAETAPRRDVQTPPQRVTVDEFVAIVRKEFLAHVKARKEGMA